MNSYKDQVPKSRTEASVSKNVGHAQPTSAHDPFHCLAKLALPDVRFAYCPSVIPSIRPYVCCLFLGSHS